MMWPLTVEQALWWLPTATVAAMTAAAVAAAAAQPWRPARKYWVAAVVLCGALAVAASAWQQARSRAALVHEADRLHDIGSRLDQLGRLLPGGPRKTEAETFDTAAAAIRALNAKISELESQIEALRQKTRARSIDPAKAATMATFLRQAGSRRVVVSCAPDDVEAYAYANQIANVLREAGWDALGPEKTTIFGEAPGMEVRLYVRNAAGPPDAANLLIDAFTRFNIPIESGIAPSEAIPDPATTELFVSHKP
jgi:hypothetical protein